MFVIFVLRLRAVRQKLKLPNFPQVTWPLSGKRPASWSHRQFLFVIRVNHAVLVHSANWNQSAARWTQLHDTVWSFLVHSSFLSRLCLRQQNEMVSLNHHFLVAVWKMMARRDSEKFVYLAGAGVEAPLVSHHIVHFVACSFLSVMRDAGREPVSRCLLQNPFSATLTPSPRNVTCPAGHQIVAFTS